MTGMSTRPNNLWFLPDDVVPGQPRREVAQEFFGNVLELGRYARQRYLDECKAKVRGFNQAELNEIDEQISIVERELAKFK